jgi:hypothetical protein
VRACVCVPPGAASKGKVHDCFGDAIECIGRVLRCYRCGLCACARGAWLCKALIEETRTRALWCNVCKCPGRVAADAGGPGCTLTAIASREDRAQRSPSPLSLAMDSPDTRLSWVPAVGALRDRRWLHRANAAGAACVRSKHTCGTLSVVTYNLLADCYATPGYFRNTDRSVLDWDERKKALISVLDALDADILCLQEVDHYHSFLLPSLRARGYDGRYKRRNGPNKRDGCATFWRTSKLALVQAKGLELDEAARASAREGPGYQTHNVALVVVLTPVSQQKEPEGGGSKSGGCEAGDARNAAGGGEGGDGGRTGGGEGVGGGSMSASADSSEEAGYVCVGNAHLFWDPAFPGVKLSQARAVVEAVNVLEKTYGPMYNLLCGDFNSLPGTQVYVYLTTHAGYTSAYSTLLRLAARNPPPPPAPPPSHTSLSASYNGAQQMEGNIGGGGGVGVEGSGTSGGGGRKDGMAAHLRPIQIHAQEAGGNEGGGGGWGRGGGEGLYEPEFSNLRDTFAGVCVCVCVCVYVCVCGVTFVFVWVCGKCVYVVCFVWGCVFVCVSVHTLVCLDTCARSLCLPLVSLSLSLM